MMLKQFINKAVDKGIAAARRDYSDARNKQKLSGSVAGFEACRDKDIQELKELLEASRTATQYARNNDKDNYWWFRCYEVEVEWICNVVSVILQDSGSPVIVPPTVRAAQTAAQIFRELL